MLVSLAAQAPEWRRAGLPPSPHDEANQCRSFGDVFDGHLRPQVFLFALIALETLDKQDADYVDRKHYHRAWGHPGQSLDLTQSSHWVLHQVSQRLKRKLSSGLG